MKLSRKNQRNSSKKYIQYRTHHELEIDDDEELGLLVGILLFVVLAWWGIVHIIDMFFDKLTWWQEPLTIIPALVIGLPWAMMAELYGKNPLHWWPAVWGTKVSIPERQPFHAYDPTLDKVLKKFGPTRVYSVDYTTLKFRCKKDAVIFSLQNF
tara:strand:+ start:1373 stop:1834 length:462 start_codon:yes stop_codon:yes gene_type:complete